MEDCTGRGHRCKKNHAKAESATVGEVYPEIDPLELTLYTGSGYSMDKKQFKTSFHLVWRDIVVDKKRQIAMRNYTVDCLSLAALDEGHFLQAAAARGL